MVVSLSSSSRNPSPLLLRPDWARLSSGLSGAAVEPPRNASLASRHQFAVNLRSLSLRTSRRSKLGLLGLSTTLILQWLRLVAPREDVEEAVEVAEAVARSQHYKAASRAPGRTVSQSCGLHSRGCLLVDSRLDSREGGAQRLDFQGLAWNSFLSLITFRLI